MPYALLFLFLMLLAFHSPTLYRLIICLVFAPIVGTSLGGFVWALAAMGHPSLITWSTFGCFILGGIVLAEVFLAKLN